MTPLDGNKTAFFEGILKASRKLELEYEAATAKASVEAAKVRVVAADFLEAYAEFNHISQEAALTSYMDFNRAYVHDIQVFAATGKYPIEIDPQLRKMSRTDYDLALILSILVMPHRCAIMEEILKNFPSGKPLVIGVGSGVELGFIPYAQGGEAYDLYINGFARQAFPQWNFHEELYRPSDHRYEAIYAIELLEHLAEPYKFVGDCYESLGPGGRLIATTASNVPQFDHRFNFVTDEEFERRIDEMGFEMKSKRLIPHVYPLMNIRANNLCQARNVFYVFHKKG